MERYQEVMFLFVVGYSLFLLVFWLIFRKIRRESGFITKKELKTRTIEKIQQIGGYSQDELNRLVIELQPQLERAKDKYNRAKIAGISELAYRRFTDPDWRKTYKQDLLSHAESYNDYAQLHEFLISVNRLIREHPDRYRDNKNKGGRANSDQPDSERHSGTNVVQEISKGELPASTEVKQNNQKKSGRDIVGDHDLPIISIDLKNAEVTVGDSPVKLSAMEFSIYCVVADRAKSSAPAITLTEPQVPLDVMGSVLDFHRKVYPKLEGHRARGQKEFDQNKSFDVERWREYVSKINAGFLKAGLDEATVEKFKITSSGPVGSKSYSILAPKGKIRIIR